MGLEHTPEQTRGETPLFQLPTVLNVPTLYRKIDTASPGVNMTPSQAPASVQDEKSSRPVKVKPQISFFTYRMLYLTEIPFLIMWAYGTYWTYLVVVYASRVRTMIWLSAAVASLLVGVGLNANAYEMLAARGRIDWGVVIRFFLIPFGVSSLSGMTNQLRDKFLLVFPRDPTELAIAIALPAAIVTSLFLARLLIVSRLPFSKRWVMAFCNTHEIKGLSRGRSLVSRFFIWCRSKHRARKLKRQETQPNNAEKTCTPDIATTDADLDIDSTATVDPPRASNIPIGSGVQLNVV